MQVDRKHRSQQLVVQGYEKFHKFDQHDPSLIEPLSTPRLVSAAAGRQEFLINLL